MEIKTVEGSNGGSYTGIVFQLQGKRTDEYSDSELWEMSKEAAVEEMTFPYTINMPCGQSFRFVAPDEINNLLVEDIPCPCGNPNHKLLAFVDYRY